MHWMRCGSCGHVCTDGYFTGAAAELLFSKSNATQQLGYEFERARAISARMVARTVRYGADAGTWLDVGFGDGSLLFTADEWGFAPVGLERREANVAALRGLGYEAHCADLAAFRRDEAVDVISMADVLEHMPFPAAALQAAGQLLRPGGTLLISLPAYNSPLWQYLDGAEANPYWGEIEHYHNFSRARLYALLADRGFVDFSYGISERYRCCMEILARWHGR